MSGQALRERPFRFSAAAAAILTGQAAAGGRHFAGVKLAPGEQRISECRVYFAPGEQQRASELQGIFSLCESQSGRLAGKFSSHGDAQYLPRYPRAKHEQSKGLAAHSHPQTDDTVSRVETAKSLLFRVYSTVSSGQAYKIFCQVARGRNPGGRTPNTSESKRETGLETPLSSSQNGSVRLLLLPVRAGARAVPSAYVLGPSLW